MWVKLPLSIPLLSSGQAELLSNSQSLSLAHCLLPTQQPCEHLCEHSSLISQPLIFKLSPPLSLRLFYSPISLFASPVVIYVVVSLEHWLWAKQTLPPHGHLLGSRNSTGQPQYLCVQTYRSFGMQAPQGLGCPVEQHGPISFMITELSVLSGKLNLMERSLGQRKYISRIKADMSGFACPFLLSVY